MDILKRVYRAQMVAYEKKIGPDVHILSIFFSLSILISLLGLFTF
jgi:hypothetical protein